MSRYWDFVHPELEKPWHTRADDQGEALRKFEDCWAQRIPHGLLEHVDGNFYDGVIRPSDRAHPDDLCPASLEGHMAVPDDRPERREFNISRPGRPILCLLCSSPGWADPGAPV